MDLPRILVSGQPADFVECQCQACSHAISSLTWPSDCNNPGSSLLKPHSNLHVIPLNASWHTVSDSAMPTGVTALNPAARHLLNTFTGGRRIPDVLAGLPSNWPANDCHATIDDMLHAGLLHPVGQSWTVPPEVPDTLVAWLHVTNACNMDCAYCYVSRTDESMNARTGYAAIDALMRSAAREGFRRVKIKYAGGEPTLCLDLVLRLHGYAEEQAARSGLEIQPILLSNGLEIDDSMLRAIARAGIKLAISLDGLNGTHDAQRPRVGGAGSVRSVRATIDRALALGIRPDANVTVTARNLEGLPATVVWLIERSVRFCLNFYRENDVDAGQFTLQPEDRALIAAIKDAFQAIESCLPDYPLVGSLLDRIQMLVPHHYACAVDHNHLAIDHYGRVSACQMAMDRPVSTVWAGEPWRDVRDAPDRIRGLSVEDKEGCTTCRWRYWCAGGCPLQTYRATGRYDVRSPQCAVYQALLPDMVRLEGLRLVKEAGRNQIS
ncbi:MAG: radical SAM protein [Anaerolineae bacterium]|nr:radical SAM protein [Anaerolineae bacterium]